MLTIAVLTGAGTAVAAPTGPRLASIVLRQSGQTQILTAGATGEERSVVFEKGSGRLPLTYAYAAPSWSPDGTSIAVTVVTRLHRARFSLLPGTAIGLVGADGGRVHVLPGTATGLEPVFAPDGARLAYAKFRIHRRPKRRGKGDRFYTSATIWMLDLTTGKSTRLTPWRNGLSQTPSSFSPDGSHLAFSRQVGDKPPEALAMAFDGSATTVLARNAREPVYSPDGSRIAFLRGRVRTRTRKFTTVTARLTDLYTVNVGGGGLTRLTHTKWTEELAPSWDPSGQRLAYTAFRPFTRSLGVLGFGGEIREINADGSCSTTILSSPQSAFFGSAWQPGSGREAGPISC